jgi:hypothetical protein
MPVGRAAEEPKPHDKREVLRTRGLAGLDAEINTSCARQAAELFSSTARVLMRLSTTSVAWNRVRFAYRAGW